MLVKVLKSLPQHGFKIIQSVSLVVSLTLTGASLAQPNQSNQPQLPRQMAWTAYNLGTTGYNQAVAIGAMLRDKYNVTLRVIP